MKNIKKINLAEVSDKQALSMDQLSKIIGGSVDDAWSSGGDVYKRQPLPYAWAICVLQWRRHLLKQK